MEERFLNRRYYTDESKKCKLYVNNNGVFKECNFLLARKKSLASKLFYRLGDLPMDIQEKYHDMSISADEYQHKVESENGKQYIMDADGTKNLITNKTYLLPIVGNFLPQDGVNAYTAVRKNGVLSLEPILVCINCHWSDLFLGNTKYGYNVFCLVSDLPDVIISDNISDIIPLEDAFDYIKIKSADSQFTK